MDADRILLEHGGRIATRVAGAEVVVTGSASVPGLEAADVDLVVTRRGSRGDAYHRLAWQLLRQDKHLLAEYRMLKGDPHDYEARKRAFFDRVVARLGDARG